MADIRPNQLPDSVPFSNTDHVIVDQNVSGVRKADPVSFVNFVAPIASQAEAEAGTDNTRRMTPLRTKQSISSEVGATIASASQGNKADSAVQNINGLIGPDVIIDKSDIGLGDVDNTSDMDKPVSTATQSAIDSATAGLSPEFNTLADLQAATVPNEINVVSVVERVSGKGGGGVWVRSTEPQGISDIGYTSGDWVFDQLLTGGWSFDPVSKSIIHTQNPPTTVSSSSVYARAIDVKKYPVTVGESYKLSALVSGSTGAIGLVRVGIYWYTSADVFISSSYPDVAVSLTVNKTRTGGYVTPPSNASYMKVAILRLPDATTLQIGGSLYVSKISVVSREEPLNAYTQDALGNWWSLDKSLIITPEMLGAFPHIACEAETKTWYDACETKPTYLHLMHMDRFIRRLKWRGIWSNISLLLDLTAARSSDALINVKLPGTYNATYAGTYTQRAGVGFRGDGASGHIVMTAWSNLLLQNSATIAVYSTPGTTSGYLLASVDGSGNVALDPRSSAGNFAVRLNSSETLSSAYVYRGGVTIATRNNATTLAKYAEGEISLQANNASVAVPTNIATIGRSGSAYQNDTVAMFVSVKSGLDANQADALAFIIRDYVDNVYGVLGSGPKCDSIGFSVNTDAYDMSNAMNQATDFAGLTGAEVRLSHGAYVIDDTFPIKGGVKTRGVHRRGTVLRFSDTSVGKDTPLYAPQHFNGGEPFSLITNLTLDVATTRRGYTNRSNAPGGSGISTLGTKFGIALSLDVLDPYIHGVDICNTGALNASGVRQYAYPETADNRLQGYMSSGWLVKDIHVENVGDDAVTTHFSYDCLVEDISAYWMSGRGNLTSSAAVEFDDGTYNCKMSNVYARQMSFGGAIKCHADNPPPSNCSAYDITVEMCGRGFSIFSSAGVGVGDFGEGNNLTGLYMTRPAFFAENEEMGLYVNNMKKTICRNVNIRGRVGEQYWRGIYFSGSNEETTLDGFTVDNWLASQTLVTGDTVRVTGTNSDVTICNGHIRGAGYRGLWDSGSTRPNYYNISIQGTNVSGSEGFRVDPTVTSLAYSVVRVISGFTTPTNLPS